MLELIKEIIAKLDYPAPKYPHFQGQMTKYDFRKESKFLFRVCGLQDSHSIESAVSAVKSVKKCLSQSSP